MRYIDRIRRVAGEWRDARRGFDRERLSPPTEADSEMGRLLWTSSPPLIHPERRFIVVFSEKAACTNVVIWFLMQLGHAKAARDFHYWPHEYRRKVYYYSELYRKALLSDLSDFKVIRVIRDPFDRVASSFRHVVRFDIADRDMKRTIGPRDLERDGLSFSEFLSFLERTDLQSCDPHFSIQRQPIEGRLKVDYLIDVSRENLSERLQQIEAQLDLERTNLESTSWVKRLRNHNRPAPELEGGAELYAQRLTRDAARKGPWPRYEDLLTPDARARIAKLYAKDIESYY
jgi:hypothetical protein